MSKQNSERITGLLEEEPISFYSSAAIAFGVNEAIVLQQISFYMNVNKKKHSQRHFIKGRWWVFNTYKQWCDEHFPWLSERGLQGVILGLEKEGVLLSMQGVENSRDRRKWYSVDRLKVAEFVQSATQKRAMHDAKSAPSHDAKSVSWMTKKVGDEIPESTSETSTERKEKEELHISAVADAIYVPSNSDDWDVAQEASDSAMFSVEGQTQNSAPAEKVKRPMSAAVSPSPLKQKMGEKSSEATTSLSPIPGGPLSLTAPIETMSPLDSNETAIDTAKKESPAQAAQRINVESLVACGYAQPITTRGWSNFKNVLKTLTEASITHDLYADFHRWVKSESVNQGSWDVTLNSLAEKNRPERYMEQRAKKAIRDAQSAPQLSTTPMGAKNAYSKRHDPAYAYLYPTPDERTNAK